MRGGSGGHSMLASSAGDENNATTTTGGHTAHCRAVRREVIPLGLKSARRERTWEVKRPPRGNFLLHLCHIQHKWKKQIQTFLSPAARKLLETSEQLDFVIKTGVKQQNGNKPNERLDVRFVISHVY